MEKNEESYIEYLNCKIRGAMLTLEAVHDKIYEKESEIDQLFARDRQLSIQLEELRRELKDVSKN